MFADDVRKEFGKGLINNPEESIANRFVIKIVSYCKEVSRRGRNKIHIRSNYYKNNLDDKHLKTIDKEARENVFIPEGLTIFHFSCPCKGLFKSKSYYDEQALHICDLIKKRFHEEGFKNVRLEYPTCVKNYNFNKADKLDHVTCTVWVYLEW